MNQKKNGKIIIILIILTIVLMLLAGVAYAYFATDIFRSDKELFFKYITQMGDKEQGFISSELIQYFEKKNNTLYENDGSFNANITTENGQEQFENVNNFDITFSGQVDTVNSKSKQDISLNYSDEVNFPISYKQIGETIGLQTKYVSSKYIAIETDELNNLGSQSDVSVGSIVNVEDSIGKIKNVEFTEEEKQHIKETYTSFINTQLQDSNFAQVQDGDTKGYKLSLNGEEIKNLIKGLLETLKNDQITLNKINEYIQTQEMLSEITQNDIDNFIKDIDNNSDLVNEKLEITVYTENKQTNKIEISTSEAKITIQKIQTGNDLQYGISIDIYNNDETLTMYLNAKYTGLQSMQSISENYELGISMPETIQYKYNFNNNINFIQNNDIGDFTEEDAMILNNYEQEQVANFMQSVFDRITQVNKMHMEQLGLEENENPIQYLIPNLLIFTSPTDIINQGQEIDEMEIASYNSKFELYESTNSKGVTVKGLLTVIDSSNESNEEFKIEEINFNGEEYEVTEQNITLIKSEINTEENYRVEFEREQNTGRIYRAVINSK